MNEPTHKIKLELVRNQPHNKWTYKFDVPPVCTAAWAAEAWVKWVDNNGQWSLKENRT